MKRSPRRSRRPVGHVVELADEGGHRHQRARLGPASARDTAAPAAVLDALLRGDLSALYDQRILDEYREVPARPKFGFDSEKVEALLRFVSSAGLMVADAVFPRPLPDPDDQPFADVAFAGGADALITGNQAHFPVEDFLPT